LTVLSELGILTRRSPTTKIVLGLIGLIIFGYLYSIIPRPELYPEIILGISIALFLSSFLIIIKQYERGVILRWGRFIRQVPEGLRFRIPYIEGVYVVDTREKVRIFKSEKMLTKDNVPVSIDSILRYKVNPEKASDAVLNVEDFDAIIIQVSQTALRDNIGSSELQDCISNRKAINTSIKEAIKEETEQWGIEVTGVEIRNVNIPEQLEHAMSMKAQAEREKDARTIYADSEKIVAKVFEEASNLYKNKPIAYALRQSNLLYESIKAKENTIIMVPSESLNHMGYGNIAMIAAYLENLEKKAKLSPDKKQQF
jgi:regulator of protease activity HflC (stomatin/prohibitin superfamily)